MVLKIYETEPIRLKWNIIKLLKQKEIFFQSKAKKKTTEEE